MDCISAQFPQIRKAEKLKSKTNIFNSNNISPKKSLEKEQSTVRKQKAKEKFQTVINPQLEKQQQENNLSSQDKFELACPQSLSNLLQNNHKTTKLQRENYILKNLKALSNEDLFFIAHECLVKNPKQRNIFDHQVLKHAFSKIKFFTELIENSGEQHMMNIVKKVQAESFTEKQIVFNQNDSGDKFYIILKGSCGVYIKNNQELEEKQNKSIVNSQECDNISQENYKIQDNIIEQTFLTASASFEKEFKQQINTSICSSQSKSNKSQKYSKQKKSKKNKPEMHDILPNARKNEFTELTILKSGDSFGEQALINNKTRMATICTIEPCEFAVLSKRDYKEIIYSIEEFKQQQELKFLRKLANFEKVSQRFLTSFKLSLKKKKFQYKEEVYKENTPADIFYIVISGEFKICKNLTFFKQKPKIGDLLDTEFNEKFFKNNLNSYTKKIELNTIQQKEVFGDIETLQKIPKRICSVECVSQEGWVYYMKAQDFLKRCDLYIEYQLLKQLILQAKFKQKQQEILVEKRKIAMDPFNEELYNELLKISKEQVDEQKEINQFIKKKQKPLQSQLHNLQETEELENINERKKGKKLLSPEKNPKQNNDISGQNSVDSQNSYSNTFKAQKNFQIQVKQYKNSIEKLQQINLNFNTNLKERTEKKIIRKFSQSENENELSTQNKIQNQFKLLSSPLYKEINLSQSYKKSRKNSQILSNTNNNLEISQKLNQLSLGQDQSYVDQNLNLNLQQNSLNLNQSQDQHQSQNYDDQNEKTPFNIKIEDQDQGNQNISLSLELPTENIQYNNKNIAQNNTNQQKKSQFDNQANQNHQIQYSKNRKKRNSFNFSSINSNYNQNHSNKNQIEISTKKYQQQFKNNGDLKKLYQTEQIQVPKKQIYKQCYVNSLNLRNNFHCSNDMFNNNISQISRTIDSSGSIKNQLKDSKNNSLKNPLFFNNKRFQKITQKELKFKENKEHENSQEKIEKQELQEKIIKQRLPFKTLDLKISQKIIEKQNITARGYIEENGGQTISKVNIYKQSRSKSMNEAQQLSERKRPSIILKQKEQLWNFHQPNETSTAEKQRQLEYYFNIQDLQPQKKKYINKTISGIRSRQNNEQLLQGDDKMINVKSYLKYKIETKNTLKKEIYNEEQYKQNNEKQNSLTVDVDQLINNGINLIDFNKSQLKRPQTQDKKLSQQQNQKYITTIFNKKRKIKSSEATLKLQRMINQTLFIKKNMTQGKRVKIKTNSFMGMVNLN